MSKKKKGGRARDRGEAVVLIVEIPKALDDALERHRQREDRTRKAVVLRALQGYLAETGDWPPKEEAG